MLKNKIWKCYITFMKMFSKHVFEVSVNLQNKILLQYL